MKTSTAIEPWGTYVSRRRRAARLLSTLVTACVLGALHPLAAGASAPVPTMAAPAAVVIPAAPVGPLSVRGCTSTAGAATCDVYAMATTAAVLGQPLSVWGFSSSGVAGSATAPGPQLVVRQGDAVTITLHNLLAGENVSLALPGQTHVTSGGATGDDQTGVALNATRSYTFTASRPGTFLYEAGHTNNGTRQVAMGLAGALVVLPAAGTAYGTPVSAYDDDALVVLSEVDPALNANPATFDMRSFRPKYRLINGKPFPATDPISTGQGRKVLLRYVNVGSEAHSMSTLGVPQVRVADDGHPLTYPEPLVTETVEPGATADTVVVMTTGGESKIALFDAAEHLDNNAQTTADPQQFAFGGMLTFLDTAAPAPSTDGVGPVAKNVVASLNPADGLHDVTITADLSDSTTGGSNVTQAEYVVDDAVTTGVGFGVPMTAAPASPFGAVSVTGVTGIIRATLPAGQVCTPATGIPPVALQCLAAGKHTLFVRAKDSAGNWGAIGAVVLNLPKTGPQTTGGTLTTSPANAASAVAVSATGDDTAAGGTITNAEYFIDTVGVNGAGVTMNVNRAAAVVSEDAAIPVAALSLLSEGAHHVFVHSKDALGLWGPPLDIPLPIDKTGPAVNAATVGPNPTNGVLTDRGNPGFLLISAAITDKDAGGALQNTVTDAEAFFDPKAGAANTPGTGLPLLPVDGTMDTTTESVYGLIPITEINALAEGLHHVYVRGKDAAGNWGPLFAIDLNVDRIAPVLGALTVGTNPGALSLSVTAPVTDVSAIPAAEFWFGAADPGVGGGTSIPVSVNAGLITVTVPLNGLPPGNQLLHLRVQDAAGNWSNVSSRTVVIARPDAIFSDAFDTLAGWTGSTGAVSTTLAAGIPAGATNHGLQVSLPGGAANTASFVTDASPAGEPTYHAAFWFDPHTLNPGSALSVLTLFDARTSADAQVFAVQYRLAAGVPQVRLVLSLTGGRVTRSAWVTLPPGAHRLRLDWRAGPAFGATAGTVTLAVDGVNRAQSTGSTAGFVVDTARLGVVAGTNATSSGTAYFDSFASTRLSQP
ncbi:MAG: hypothetical protein QOE84_3611 [Actinomycetota bacterium]|nr:hypothetical protein [Actinomycetota bacterium]